MQPRHDTEFSRSIPATAQQVSAASVDFPRVARSLEPGFYAEAGAFHGLRDVRHLQEAEVDVYVLAPPLVQVPDLGTGVEGNEHQPAGPQHAADLREGRGKLARLQVDDRVERDDRPELAIARRQVKEIPSRNSVSGYARRLAATMPADRSMPTAAPPWPAIQAATCPGPQPTSAIGMPCPACSIRQARSARSSGLPASSPP